MQRSRRRTAHVLMLGWIVLASLAGCTLSRPARPPAASAGAQHVIYVVRRELHTGIAIEAAQWPNRQWPLLAVVPEARYLEFGWGDATYYQAPEETVWMALGAVLWPSPGVVEVLAQVELPAPPNVDSKAVDSKAVDSNADVDVIAVPVTGSELQAMAQSIEQTFTASSPIPTGTAWTSAAGESRFYYARGNFHLFRMCNRWTATQLRAAGCALSPWPVLIPSQVMGAARRCQAAHQASE